MKMIGVYGASGFGREVMPVVAEQFRDAATRLVFVDDGMAGRQVNGRPCLNWDQFLSTDAPDRQVVLAIASSEVRRKLDAKVKEAGVGLVNVQAVNSLMMDEVELGEGAILAPFVTLTSNIRIGRHFHANIYSYVAHDCVIGDFVTFAPGVKCNGNVVVEDGAYIGTGAILKQGRPGAPLRIGAGAVVGMGAVVTRDVLPSTTVVGNPARILEAKN